MDTLLAYLEAPEQSDFRDLRLHLVACSDCRGNIKKLRAVQNTLQQTGLLQSRIQAPSAQLAQALKLQTIERYIDGELQEPQARHVEALLKSDSDALKVALHYASHSQRSESEAPQTATPASISSAATRAGNTISLLDRIRKFLDFKPPVWISVPATAAIVLTLTTAILLTWQASPAKHLAIATYQDKAVIHFQGASQLPGIGFFSKAHSSTQAFGPMKISYDKSQTLSLQWPPVAEAAVYHLALYLIADGQKITVKEMDVTVPHASITDFEPIAGKRYEWALNGETKLRESKVGETRGSKTGDSQTFYTSGGFVINNL